MSTDLAAILISVLALFFSVWSWRKGFEAQKSGNQTQEQLAKLQERLVNLKETKYQLQREEATKARLTVEVVRESSQTYKIWLRNTGQSAAKNLQVDLDDTPYHQHPHIGNRGLPSSLSPNEKVSIAYHDANDYVPPSKIRITWVNKNGEQDTHEALLQIP